MSLTDDFLNGLNKKKKKALLKDDISPVVVTTTEDEEDIAPVSTLLDPFSSTSLSGAQNSLNRQEAKEDLKKLTKIVEEEEKEAKENSGWFKAGGFSDGKWDAFDLTLSVLGTAGDVVVNATKGLGNMVEGVTDLLLYGVSKGGELVGADSFADDMKNLAKQNLVNDALSGVENDLNEYSFLGNKADSVSQGLGQVGGIMLTGGAGSAAGLGSLGTTVLTTGTMGLSSWGGGMSEAYQSGEDVSDEDAWAYGFTKGVVDAGSELLFGGLGKTVKALGLSKGLTSLDDVFARKLSSKISNLFAKSCVQFGVKASAEGLEEVLAGIGTAAAKKLTYMSDEDWDKLLADENLLDQFIVGAVTSGIAQSGLVPGMSQGSLKESIQTGKDFITGMTQSEQTVVEKVFESEVAQQEENGKTLTKKEKSKLYDEVVEKMESGRISTDTIEEILGGETYTAYKETLDGETALKDEQKALQTELDDLNNKPWQERNWDRIDELETKIEDVNLKVEDNKTNSKLGDLRKQLDDKMSLVTKDTKLRESYNEVARRYQKIEIDPTQYSGAAKKTAESIVNAKWNNTNSARDAANFLIRVSQDQGIPIEALTAKEIAARGFGVEGKTVNGANTKDGIIVNWQSPKYLNSTVGHEIVHVLKKDGLYEPIRAAMKAYSESKGDYQTRYDSTKDLYTKKDADGNIILDADGNALYLTEDGKIDGIEEEVIADLVGDYLFTDHKFVEHLLATDENVFKRVWNEIKYFVKIATSGSSEQKKLLEAQRAFERAYTTKSKNPGSNTTGTQHSLSNGKSVSDTDGKELTKEQQEYFKDSKMRDENGNLKVMYHGSQDAGFHTFDASRSDDGTSLFFVDRNDVAASYSGTYETYEAKAFQSVDDANNFFESIGKTEYEVVEKDGKYALLDDGDEIATGTLDELYNEFCDYEGVGYGDANYKVYLNLKNPLEVDANGRNWDNVTREFSPEIADKYYSLTAEEKAALTNLASWEDIDIFRDEIRQALADTETGSAGTYDEAFAKNIRSAYEKLAGVNIYDLFSIAGDNFSDLAIEAWATKQMTTRDYAAKAKAEGYDGVIFKNIHDNGGYSNGSEGASTVAIAFDSNQIKSVANTTPTKDADIRYSLSDSDGRQLTKEQSEYFKESKIRDADGNLKVMYHGTPNGDYTIFKDGTYFTDNKEYADKYQNPGASSLSVKQTVSNPKTFEVYLDIKKPFDITDAEARRIYIEEYIRGGNAIGINPYLSDAEYDKISTIDWTEGEDLRDFLIENGYDYDGLVLDEGATGGYGDEVKSRGTSYVVFSPEQAKSVDNKTPTSDPDIRFSLSEAVEETKDLIAVHNLHAAELLETLKLSGLPSPSVAIIKAKDGHEKYGDVSLILPKDAIDPQANKANRIYGSDAWTPTRGNAPVEYEVNYDTQRQFERTVEQLANNVANGIFSRSSILGMAGIEDSTSMNLKEIADKISDYDAVKAAYVAENGGDVDVVYRTKVFDSYGNDALESYISKVGEQEVARLAAKMLTGERLTTAEIEAAKDSMIESWVAKHEYTLKRKPELREGRIAKYRENLGDIRVEDFVEHAWAFYEDSGATSDEVDRLATSDNLRAAASRSDVAAWVTEKLQGLLSEPAIYNGKDPFTPNGKRRSFQDMHWEYTAENIVRAMSNADARGANVWNVSGEAIIATATPEYKSINDVRADKDRLFKAEKGDYDQIKDEISNELQQVTTDIVRTTEQYQTDNQYDEEQSIGRVIMEAAQGTKTLHGIKQVFEKNGYRIGDAQAKAVLALFDHASKVPTGYFEAKPQRVVGFDEVGVYVIPRNADVKLKQELLNRGYSIAEYDPDVEGDRQRVVNQFEQYKFSLSNVGEQSKQYGDWHISGEDLALQEIAPIENSAQNVQKNSMADTISPADIEEETAETEQPIAEDVVPVAEETEVTEVTEETEMFPDDLAPIESELDRLLTQKEDLESRMLEVINKGDYDTFSQIDAEYKSVMEKYNAVEKAAAEADADRLDSLDDADAPVETEHYPGEASWIDPFADRNEYAVGNPKVNAFSYDHPEVRPYFQKAAWDLLNDLNNSQPGERWFNDEVYYASGGEKGIGGQKRLTTDDIALFKDSWGFSWDALKQAAWDIANGNGAENYAIAKRVEFLLNERLLHGYTNIEGDYVAPSQAYQNALKLMANTENSADSFANLVAQGDEIASADISPVMAEDTTAAESAPIEDAPVAEEYEAIRPAPSNEPKMVRADSKDKQRKWVKTSTESEAVDGKVKPEELDQDMIHYQPIPNKKTLGNANTKLDNMGYDASLVYFNARFNEQKITLDDIALGERLVQEAIKRGDTKTASDLITDISILGTELGQKVQALSIIKRLSPEGQLRSLKRLVERGKTKGDKAYKDVEVTQEMADEILNVYNEDGSYDQDYLNEMVEDVKQKIADQMKVTVGDKINAWRYLSMLGAPKTHARNLVSNVAMKGTLAVKNAIARTIEDIAPIENRTKTWKQSTKEVKDFAKRTTKEMSDVISGTKYSDDGSIKAMRKIYKSKVLGTALNFASDTNSNLLSAEDGMFSKPAFKNALSEFLTANGIRTEQDIKKNPEIVAKAKQHALAQAKIATFQQDSWVANKIGEIERKNGVLGVGVGAIMPFKKTPINIAKTGLAYSPLGIARNIYDAVQVGKGNMEASEAIDHLAQTLTGTSLAVLGYALASMGVLNGAGGDDKESEYDYQLGEQSYSVTLGGNTYSLSWLSPVAMPLFVGANAYEQLVEGRDWDVNVVVEALGKTLDPLSEMSVLSGLDDVLSSYDSGAARYWNAAETMAQNYITQFVPTLSSQIAATFDDTKRTTKVSGDSGFDFGEETVRKLMQKIPGLRNLLEPSTDIWGNEIEQSNNVLENFLAPWSEKENITSAVDEEIKDLYSQTGDGGVIPSIPYNYINYDGEKYNMSASEFTEYKKAYGQTAYDLLQDLFATNTYKNADSETRAEMVNMVYDYARDEAKKAFLSNNGVEYTNATADGAEYYNENAIKGAIQKDMPVDEYKFYKKYPGKYAFLKDNGVSYSQYESFSEDERDAWNWAFNNPDKYKMSKAVSNDVVAYRKYTSDLYDIKADKDENGKTISGSRKEKVIDYLNNLDIDYGAKIILFKSEYESDDTYNMDIIDYLNSRSDISYQQMKSILEELGFHVDSQGNISWD